MSHINTGVDQPGIVELLFYKGPTGKALSKLANTILHGPSPLSKGEREVIAAYVSRLNECNFCHDSHKVAANVHLSDTGKIIDAVLQDVHSAPISEKLKALLPIAAKVQRSGRHVTPEDIAHARVHGATDEDIHDTVLIAAAFCMYNRYVDGLGTRLPHEKSEYEEMGQRMSKGYKYPPLFLRKWVVKQMNKKAQKSKMQS